MTVTYEALWNKSKVIVERGLECRDRCDFDMFQFWAAVALELLGKAALAKVHPILVVNPEHFKSVLVAVGHSHTPDVKTILAKTVFERCKHLVRGFDESAEKFCMALAGNRNAELHSGHVPFASTSLSAWQPKYWSVVKLLVESQGETLASLLGSDEARSANAIITDASTALAAAVEGRIQRHKAAFELHSQNERQQLAQAVELTIRRHLSENETDCPCPSCGCLGTVTGSYQDEVPGDRDDDEPWLRWMTRSYAAEAFRCLACKLELHSSEELEAAEIATEFEKEALEEAYDGDPYGND